MPTLNRHKAERSQAVISFKNYRRPRRGKEYPHQGREGSDQTDGTGTSVFPGQLLTVYKLMYTSLLMTNSSFRGSSEGVLPRCLLRKGCSPGGVLGDGEDGVSRIDKGDGVWLLK